MWSKLNLSYFFFQLLPLNLLPSYSSCTLQIKEWYHHFLTDQPQSYGISPSSPILVSDNNLSISSVSLLLQANFTSWRDICNSLLTGLFAYNPVSTVVLYEKVSDILKIHIWSCHYLAAVSTTWNSYSSFTAQKGNLGQFLLFKSRFQNLWRVFLKSHPFKTDLVASSTCSGGTPLLPSRIYHMKYHCQVTCLSSPKTLRHSEGMENLFFFLLIVIFLLPK